MKTSNHIQFALLFAAATFFTKASSAQTWQTVDQFQYVQGADNSGLAVAPSGLLFAAGTGEADTGYRGLIRMSADNGSTWSTLDDFLYPGLNYTINSGIVSDATGNLYVAGTAYDDGSANGGPFHWIVRRSTNGGATWSIVDDFAPGGQLTQANAIASDAAGNVYVAGFADYGNGTFAWTIRKGVGGLAFTTVDSFTSGDYPGPGGIYVHPTSGIFAVGSGKVTSRNVTSLAWIVRRSTNGGTTWQTVDTFQLSSGSASRALAVGADTLGNCYVVGRGNVLSKGKISSHWLVRKSVNGGAPWSTVDDSQLAANNSAEAHCLVTDSSGNLLVAGQAGSTTGNHWIVRQNSGGTGAWTTVDDASNASAEAIAANVSGNVFVGGASSVGWLVRKR
jgi:hypothetical protein